MEIPSFLVDEIRRGSVVLFLGAGASKGAKIGGTKSPPTAAELSKSLADQFLGGKFQKEPLHLISDLAVNESSLGEVQDYIAKLFQGIEPAEFHRLIPTFRWYGIASTNYDLLLEKTYGDAKDRVQELRPIISDRDKIDEIIRLPSHVAYLKLHGCVSRTHDKTVPMILTVEQYITHRTGRDRLFRSLFEWGYNHPIVFIGHGLQDFDIRALLVELSKLEEYRPQYYLVTPSPIGEIMRVWASQRITVLDGTFETFLQTLDSTIPKHVRPLLSLISTEHPIKRRLINREDLSPN